MMNKTRDMLAKFLKTGKVLPEFAGIGNYYKNICYLNKTRRIATKLCCDKFVKNKKHFGLNFKYDGRVEYYNVAKDMPVFVTQNLKKEDIYNMMEFKIQEIEEMIDEDNNPVVWYKINGKWFDHNVFRHNFIPLFCCTVCKYQGADIDEHFNILDVNRMDKK